MKFLAFKFWYNIHQYLWHTQKALWGPQQFSKKQVLRQKKNWEPLHFRIARRSCGPVWEWVLHFAMELITQFPSIASLGFRAGEGTKKMHCWADPVMGLGRVAVAGHGQAVLFFWTKRINCHLNKLPLTFCKNLEV